MRYSLDWLALQSAWQYCVSTWEPVQMHTFQLERTSAAASSQQMQCEAPPQIWWMVTVDDVHSITRLGSGADLERSLNVGLADAVLARDPESAGAHAGGADVGKTLQQLRQHRGP